MKYLPGLDSIVDEILVVCTLAQCSIVSLANFRTVPYVEDLVRQRAAQVLMEKLLSISIKVRFLDNAGGLLRRHDRRLITIGKYREDDVECPEQICIRHALNKLVHHKTINVSVVAKEMHVVAASTAKYSKLVPLGNHSADRVIVNVRGNYGGRAWEFEIDLFILLDELMRVFEKELA